MSELAIRESHAVMVLPEQVELIKRTVAKDATPDELKLYFYDCQRQGVHPLDKLIHFTKRGGRYVPITSIDFMRMKAGETQMYAGSDDAVFNGTPSHKDFEAKITVYRFVQGQRCSWSATARWAEYYPGDQQGHMWKKMPYVMLAKCAEALALRKAFADVLHGLYIREEMDQAERTSDTRPLKDKIQAKVVALTQPEPSIVEDPDLSDEELRTATKPLNPDLLDEETYTDKKAGNYDSDSDPAEPFRAKLRTCERTNTAINATYQAIPDYIRQDCHEEYTAQLKSISKKRG